MTTATTTPRLEDLLVSLVQQHARNTFGGWMPGRVVEYDATLRKAHVELLLRDTDPTSGAALAYPVLVEVPVLMPFHIVAPVPVGTTVLVIFGSRSTDKWLQQGGLVDPDDPRTHDLSDGLAIPGLMDFAHVATPSPAVEFTTEEIHAGGSAPLARTSELAALQSLIGSWVLPVTPTPANILAALGQLQLIFTSAWTTPGTAVLKGA